MGQVHVSDAVLRRPQSKPAPLDRTREQVADVIEEVVEHVRLTDFNLLPVRSSKRAVDKRRREERHGERLTVLRRHLAKEPVRQHRRNPLDAPIVAIDARQADDVRSILHEFGSPGDEPPILPELTTRSPHLDEVAFGEGARESFDDTERRIGEDELPAPANRRVMSDDSNDRVRVLGELRETRRQHERHGKRSVS